MFTGGASEQGRVPEPHLAPIPVLDISLGSPFRRLLGAPAPREETSNRQIGVIWLEVFVKENESLERALRRFKRKVQRSGLYSELRKRRFYEKPSAQRKRQREAAIRRERRRQRRAKR